MSCCCKNTDSVNQDNKVKIRECTDIFSLWVFIFFWILMFLIATFAYVYGNPKRLINGYDSFGNICASEQNEKFGDFELSGVKTSDKPYLFFMDFQNIDQSLQICVKQCPDKDMIILKDIEDFYKRTGSLLCRYDMDFNISDYKNLPFNSAIGPCPTLPVPKSISLFNRCVPEMNRNSGIFTLNKTWNVFNYLFGKLCASWLKILFLTLFSFVLSLFIVFLLYMLAKSVAWIIMTVSILTSVVLTIVLWWIYLEIKCKLDSVPSDQLSDEDINNEDAYKWYSIISAIFTLGVLITVFSLRNRTSVLVTVFQDSSNCLSEIPLLYLQPVISFFLLLAFYIFWISVILCLASAGFPESKNMKLFSVQPTASFHYDISNLESMDLISLNTSVNKLNSFTIVNYKDSFWLKYMLFVYFFGLIWISEFILNFQHMIVAGSVAKWYFSKTDKDSKSIVLTSTGKLICYHVGSVVLGSIIIPLLKIPRIILLYLYRILQRNEHHSYSAKYMSKCCTCTFFCFNKFIQHINHNAYAVIMLQGINFRPAAYRAWKITTNNAVRLAIVNNISDIILFLGKCFVTSATTCIALLIFKYDSTLNLFASSILIVCIIAYFISDSIISLYELVADTIFLCICEDQKINGNERQWKTTLLANIEYSGIKMNSEPPPTEL